MCGALSTFDTLRFFQIAPKSRTHKGFETTFGAFQSVYILNLVADIATTSTIDAIAGIQRDGGGAFVSPFVFFLQFLQSCVSDSEVFTELLQLATSVLDAFGTVVGVSGKDDLHRFSSEIQQFLSLGDDGHSLFTGSGAGPNSPAVNIHHADTAIAKSRQVFMITEVWHRISGFLASVQNLGVPGYFYNLSVDVYFDHVTSPGAYSSYILTTK
jgi:hypothetical protein